MISLADYLGEDGKPDRERIADLAAERLEEGAQLLDVTAFSGRMQATADEELRRYVPVLRKLVSRIAVPIVMTTIHAETAERLAGMGVDVIRDPSGLRHDPELAKTVRPTDAALLLGSTVAPPPAEGEPGEDPVTPALRDLSAAVGRVAAEEIDARRVAVEPQLSSPRRKTEAAYLLRHLSAFHKLRRPVAVELAGSDFLVDSVKVAGEEREAADAAGTAMAVAHGVQILRTPRPAMALRAAYVAEQMFDSDDEEK